MSQLTAPISSTFMRPSNQSSGTSNSSFDERTSCLNASSSSSSISSMHQTSPSSTTSLRPSVKTSKSSNTHLRSVSQPLSVRFLVPNAEPEGLNLKGNDINLSTALSSNPPTMHHTSSRSSATVPPHLKKDMHKRLSVPAPISKKKARQQHPSAVVWTGPTPTSLHVASSSSSAPTSTASSRQTSFESRISAQSVPLPSITAPFTSTPLVPTPSDQYDPLQHYIPCLAPKCSNHYNTALISPSFELSYSAYKLVRKQGLCPNHATRDLKLANDACKRTWETMRQNAGRKTLGLVAAEFEIWMQEVREQRQEESKRNIRAVKKMLYGDFGADDVASGLQEGHGVISKKTKKKEKEKEKEKGNGEGKEGGNKGTTDTAESRGTSWNWKYTPRPCTRKNCTGDWYSPFDARLYLFYHTPRKSMLVPLSTLCPPCARKDVVALEEKLMHKKRTEEDKREEWKIWLWQVQKRRKTESEFWERAQERIVREQTKVLYAAEKQENSPEKVEKTFKERKSGIRDVCVVM